jgi:hypothetical protein
MLHWFKACALFRFSRPNIIEQKHTGLHECGVVLCFIFIEIMSLLCRYISLYIYIYIYIHSNLSRLFGIHFRLFKGNFRSMRTFLSVNCTVEHTPWLFLRVLCRTIPYTWDIFHVNRWNFQKFWNDICEHSARILVITHFVRLRIIRKPGKML